MLFLEALLKCTVEPPNKGYFGTGNYVLRRAVVLFLEVQLALSLLQYWVLGRVSFVQKFVLF